LATTEPDSAQAASPATQPLVQSNSCLILQHHVKGDKQVLLTGKLECGGHESSSGTVLAAFGIYEQPGQNYEAIHGQSRLASPNGGSIIFFRRASQQDLPNGLIIM